MKSMTFLTMQLLQRADDALLQEQEHPRPNRLKLIWLKHRRRQLTARLRRSLAAFTLAGA